MNKTQCALCGTESHYASMLSLGGTSFGTPFYECPGCGRYVLGEGLAMHWKGSKSEEAFKIACIVREKQLAESGILYGVMEDNFEATPQNIAKHLNKWWRISDLVAEFPKAKTMVDRALANLARRAQHPMDRVRVGGSEVEYLTFCRGFQLTDIFDHMKEVGLIGVMEMHSGGVDYSISPRGWARLEELAQTNAASKQAFVAMWFDPLLDAVFKDGIAPGVRDAGFDCKRMDAVEHNNKICDEIVAEIRRSRFVVADFTGQRGGVYFEAGFAMGLGLPVIWTVRKDQIGQVHFDTRQYNHIVYETPEELRIKLHNRIAATIR